MKAKELFLVTLGIGVLLVLLVFLVVRIVNEENNTENNSSALEEKIVTVPDPDPVVPEEEEEDSNDGIELTEPVFDEERPATDDPNEDTSENAEEFQGGDIPDPEEESSDESEDETPASDSDIDFETVKVNKYYNAALEYGFLMPYRNYYSGFGPQEGARHSVGLSTEEIPEAFSDSEVQVLFYGTTDVPELADKNFYQEPDGNKTYLKLADEINVVIIGDYQSDEVNMIIQSVYVGPNQYEEEEEATEE